jgi:2-polyprenyl-3-methyl-5-hydroxy-6-metoxy-1,4-benzoquinol methylase
MSRLDELTSVLKLLADQTRLRILATLSGNELTVKELTEILQVGQSTLSTQLGQLKEAGLVAARKQGQFVFYRIPTPNLATPTGHLWQEIVGELPGAEWFERDQRQLAEVLQRRREASISFFNTVKSQNQTSPGQTWQSLAFGLGMLIHGKIIADLGCGVGRLSAQLAESGNTVTGVDNSQEQINAARRLSKSLVDIGVLNFSCAAMEATGLTAQAFDIVIVSQALHHAAQPQEVLREARRILVAGGCLLVLDLVRHNQEWIQDRFADFWLGFDPEELANWVRAAGFSSQKYQIGSPDPDYPDIEPVILLANK